MTKSSRITHLALVSADNTLEVEIDGQRTIALDAEFLRVHSPSAEVRGHGVDEGTLQTGKRFVKLTAVEPVGRYGVKLVYDDGHNTGIYTWDTLIHYATHHDSLWQSYLERLEQAGASREPANAVKWIPK